jgi:hypothetical protein
MRPSVVVTRAALALAVAFAVAAAPHAAAAQASTDPVGDFLPTYVGPRNADVDITAVDFTWNGGSTFTLFSRSAGDLGQTPGALFVWGIDRGQGTARFPTLAPGVLFDLVVVVNPFGQSSVTDLVGGGSTPLDAAAVRVVGSELFVELSASLLPSRGRAPDAYTANLWPRVGAGNNNQISDFAPDNSNVGVRTIPEPATTALVAFGLAATGALAARRRRRA